MLGGGGRGISSSGPGYQAHNDASQWYPMGLRGGHLLLENELFH